MKAGKILQKYNISRSTLYRWIKSGRVSYTILPSGRYEYEEHLDKYKINNERKNIIYARVFSATQKNNLSSQVERIKTFASAKGLTVDDVYTEVASALNYNRIKYRKLFQEVKDGKIDNIFIEYKDRLLRIGFEDFQELCKLCGTTIHIVDNSTNSDKSKQQEITDDLISIIHHFSSKIYSERRIKNITDSIKSDATDV